MSNTVRLIPDTARYWWRPVLSGFRGSSSYSTHDPQLAEPDGDEVIGSRPEADLYQVAFFGRSAADDLGDCRVVGWSRQGAFWMPYTIVEVSFTFGTTTGVAGEIPPDDAFLADTITFVAGDTSARIISPEDNTVGSLVFDALGALKVSILLKTDTASQVNALWRPL